MADIKHEIVKKVGVLSKTAPALSYVEGSGWAKTPFVPLRRDSYRSLHSPHRDAAQGTLCSPPNKADLGEEVQPDQLERP